MFKIFSKSKITENIFSGNLMQKINQIFQIIALILLGLAFILFGVLILFLPEVKEKAKKVKGSNAHDKQ